ncbi:MAG TPA: c-type cytochrome [Acidobacteriaceae bacterium]|nr:c-type cytochrome [Acidobacteriaceae bacterium]
MRICLLAALTSLMLAAAGCTNTSSSAPAGAEPAVPTNVGPVPGGVSTPVERKNPYAGNAVAIQAGWRIFNWYNCSGCHGGHGGGGMGPSLRDKVWLYGNRDGQIFDSIAQGRSNGMPAWGTKIPEQQIWQLVAYIKSMRTPQEADPPNEPANEQTPNPLNNDRMMVGTQVQ